MFDLPAFDAHEKVVDVNDPETGLKAIIAIHSTARGPAAGGCRLWTYAGASEARTDALRLSRGMSYKNAMADLPFGGGKAVIMGPVEPHNREAVFAAFGRAVDSLGGQYITAEDVGVGVADMMVVARETRYVSGLAKVKGQVGGDPSPFTARGVRIGIEAAVKARLNRDSLDGLRIAVQGLGHVGGYLCDELYERGAKLIVADINAVRTEEMIDRYGAEVVDVKDILTVEADVVAPCALGGIITPEVAEGLRAGIVAGAANNQLSTAEAGAVLQRRGVLYAPDYVINAGGIIAVSAEYHEQNDPAAIDAQIEAIGPRLHDIFDRARKEHRLTQDVADTLARAKMVRV
ncbi:Glu/Leu/Phe/Val dehydrogenase dimerization domain-containing protein [Asticcacaulis sp. BYS171W]|uniref:Glu/Leu/Phe/Val dehydrogenase dimerization domain-containing protein n=1 Tax=Asticcacaulis aquaticus TaxID=2984212 RepID=A0ABT5HUQ5_9CAUL|nr:Glu/Leu/Phe/Val dehydrogenase dimerization domain-containing protein [Asticcacaulis aquaticus]MDC7683709.1 Glu/Leu/Phe/Val dehydrogenase dimerization domain-containing protein [Asticcacaulis aquaticus]